MFHIEYEDYVSILEDNSCGITYVFKQIKMVLQALTRIVDSSNDRVIYYCELITFRTRGRW